MEKRRFRWAVSLVFICNILEKNKCFLASTYKSKFRWSASKYNYDSQAYIYQQLFGYEMLFIAIDKTTHQIGIFDCSPEFLQRGADKVKKAVEQYQLFYRQVYNFFLFFLWCDAVLADVGSIIDFMESGGGVNVAFTGPTFSGGVFGDGVGGAIRKEDSIIIAILRIKAEILVRKNHL